MANLLKPSVDQAVFGHSFRTHPVRRGSNRENNVSFLGEDEAGAPVATKVAGAVRAVGTVAVLVAGLALTGRF